MILGIGLDLVEVGRVRASISRQGARFLKRIGHPGELKAGPKAEPRRSEYWAARFAAKEAFAKALGTGIGAVVGFDDVGVVKDRAGRPGLAFAPALKRELARRGVTGSHLTLTHSSGMAGAVVVLEGARRDT